MPSKVSVFIFWARGEKSWAPLALSKLIVKIQNVEDNNYFNIDTLALVKHFYLHFLSCICNAFKGKIAKKLNRFDLRHNIGREKRNIKKLQKKERSNEKKDKLKKGIEMDSRKRKKYQIKREKIRKK